VNDVAQLDDHRPHVAGTARCIGCKMKWVFVAPAEVDLGTLECPGCGERRSLTEVPS
jgi:hypothetical protein